MPQFPFVASICEKGTERIQRTLSFVSVITLHTIACVYFSFISLGLVVNGTRRTPRSQSVCARESFLRRGWAGCALVIIVCCNSSSAQLPSHWSACPSPCPADSVLVASSIQQTASCWGHSRRPLRVNARNSHTHVSRRFCTCTLHQNSRLTPISRPPVLYLHLHH